MAVVFFGTSAVTAEGVTASRSAVWNLIGVDEVSYRNGHRYLSVVADHDHAGRVVWAGVGKNAATLEGFYDQLGGPDARSYRQ